MTERGRVKTFEDLNTWQEAIELARDVYALTREGQFAKDFGLRDQIRRACVSISANIAEGFERRTTKEYLHFLSIAKGSAGEVRSLVRVAFEVGYLKPESYEALKNRLIRLSQTIANQIKMVRQKAKAIGRDNLKER